MTKSLAAKPLQNDVDPQRQQRLASDPKATVWVSASAGSGKTTVLTKRVTRLLLEGVKPERILCLTFTKAAAAEMAIRVTGKLSAWATCSDDELSRDVGELQDAPPSAKQMTAARRLFAATLCCPGGLRIRTIHSFAQEILRRFPIEAGLPPHFTVIEESDARAMQEEALLELLQEPTTTPAGRALTYLVTELGEKNVRDALRDVLHDKVKLTTAIKKAGSLDKLMLETRTALEIGPKDTVAQLVRDAVAAIPNYIKPTALQLAEDSSRYSGRARKILDWLALDANARIAAFNDYLGGFLTKEEQAFSEVASKALKAKHPQIEEILQREAGRLENICMRRNAIRMAETTEAVLALGLNWVERYEKRKSMRAAMDYDDLIIHTNQLLRKPNIAPWILYKLDGGIDHILVDEAQDTSRAQWDIVQTLADEFYVGKSARSDINRTMFAVGDEKQSIFSFQNADPEAFATMQTHFASRAADAGKDWQPVGLNVSFRSAPAVLHAVDAVFANDATRAGVSMMPVRHIPAPLRQGDNPKIGRVEVWPLIAPPKAEKSDDGQWALPVGYEDEEDPQAELANRIAAKIDGWIKNKEILPGADRPIGAGDVMILLRRRGRFADLMVRALKKHKVAVSGVDRMHLIQQIAVMDLLALLQFMLLPEDDLNLATVLRGPLLNLSEDQLMQLAMGRKGSLWHALTERVVDIAYAPAHAYLLRWLNMTDFITPFAMLAHILNEACPGSVRSGRHAIWSRLGLDALDPVEELLNAAQNFSRNNPPSLQTFLHWLETGDTEIKRELDHSDGQVKIMTVHASKGLEAPIVFLPDTGNLPQSQKVDNLLWDGDVPIYTTSKPDTGVPRVLWDQARRKQLEEYRRLLYVALTRAVNRVYVGGWEAKKEADSSQSWYNLIKEALEPLNEASALEKSTEPQPLIAIADPILKSAKKSATITHTAQKITLPAWALRPAPKEKAALQTIAPSHIAQIQAEAPATATPDIAFARGRIIHRLLQSLPDVAAANREKNAAQFLANPQHRLNEAQQKEIAKEVLGLLTNSEYAPMFGPGSRAEVPIAGYAKGRAITGQVDRLLLADKTVWIVDFKTNRPPPGRPEDVPEAYRLQLASYRDVLREIYPDRTIRCFLVWTYGPRLMELPEALLAA